MAGRLRGERYRARRFVGGQTLAAPGADGRGGRHLETILDSAASTPLMLSALGDKVITVTLSHDTARGTEITGVALLRREPEVSYPEPTLLSAMSLALQQASVSAVVVG